MRVRVCVGVGGGDTVLCKGDGPGPKQAPVGLSGPNRLEVECRNPRACA